MVFDTGEDRVSKGRQEVVSLFVENLPETLHWKGLWFWFARHGDVVNVYIARKRSRGGKRFGFVRMKNLEEAERVIQRLHGFTLYGSKLSVKRARNNYGWERMALGRTQRSKQGTMGFGDGSSKGHGEGVAATGNMLANNCLAEESMVKDKPKKVTGHVENEDLWQLRRCLVGVLDTICSVNNVHDRLVKWGLGEINVQRLGAKMFLLTIEDEDLYLMLEDVNWPYLNEIFQEVVPWSEKFSYSERATWLEIRGLPLHCWNGVTLKKTARLWGSFEALGENDKHTMDCEKARVLIATNQVRRIEEIIDVEVGDCVFQVSVREVGFNDGTSYPLCNKGNNETIESEKTDESTSKSKLDTVRNNEEEKVDRSQSGTEEEVFQAMWIERNCINRKSSREQIKLSELVGGELKDTLALDGVESREGESRGVGEPTESKEGNVVAHAVSVQGKLGEDSDIGSDKGCGLEARPLRNFTPLNGPVSKRVEGVAETNSVVKLCSKELEGGGVYGQVYEQKKSWADRINEKVNSRHFDSKDSIEEDESGRGFLTELEDIKGERRKMRAKKYGSLLDIQNKSISDKERRRRDKALKKRSWCKENLDRTELSGKSLSDTDINNRVSKIINEAKQVLKLGKKIGVNFLGEEKDVINDIVDIELNELR
ncbi:hypothetical protein GQ457_11G030450 [Hibiscus cannabinus]